MSYSLMQRYLLAAYVVICPIVYTMGSYGARSFQETVWNYLGMIFVASFCANIWMFLFFAYACLLVFQNGLSVGQDQLFNLFLGILIFTCSKSFFKSFKFDIEMKWLLLPGLLTITWMVFQHYGIDPMQSIRNNDGSSDLVNALNDKIGLFGLKAHNGIYLAIITCVISFFQFYLAPLMMILVAISSSSGAIMSCAISLVYLSYYKSRLVFIIMLCSLIPLSIFYMVKYDYGTAPKMFSSRLSLWHGTFKMSLARLTGYGPGSFDNRTPNKDFMFFGDQDYRFRIGYFLENKDGKEIYGVKTYDPNFANMHKNNEVDIMKSPNRWDNAHNLPLQILFEYGIPGLLFFILFLREMWINYKRSIKSSELVVVTSIIIVYLVSSLTQFPLFVSRLGFFVPIVVGAFYSLTERDYERTRKDLQPAY